MTDKIQCQQITGSCKQCQRLVSSDTGYCFQHNSHQNVTRSSPRLKRGSVQKMIGGYKGGSRIVDALNKHKFDLAMRLIRSGENPNALGHCDFAPGLISPLHMAVQQDLPGIVQALLGAGADPIS